MPDETSVDGAAPSPSEPRGWNEEFADEAADHLAEAARDAERAGATDAGAEALRRFGSLEKTWLRCLWVHEGDSIMARALQAGAAVLAVALLVVLTGATWQGQRRLATRLDDVAASLQSVADAQGRLERIQSALAESRAAAPPAAPVIKGRVYLGDPSRPASDVQLRLHSRSSDFKRRIMTSQDGTFDTGLLPPDRYFFYCTPLDEAGRPDDAFAFNTSDIDLTTGETPRELELNAMMLTATVRVEVDGDELPLVVESKRGLLTIVPEVALVLTNQERISELRLPQARWDSPWAWRTYRRIRGGSITGGRLQEFDGYEPTHYRGGRRPPVQLVNAGVRTRGTIRRRGSSERGRARPCRAFRQWREIHHDVVRCV